MEQTDIQEIKDKVDRMYFALLGNDIAKDGGLVGRIEKLEDGQKDVKVELQEIKIDRSIFKLNQKLLYSAAGVIITFLVKIIFGV